MDTNFTDVLVTVLPMLLLVGAWIFFMNRMKSQGGLEFSEFERRKVEALERIAAALEKRP